MLPFEMRTVLSEMRLFNDDPFRHGHHIYMKCERRERVQDNGETGRDRDRERDRAWQREEVVSVVKWTTGKT
jgi:hypothetical protein